jgi:hypothetical protein
MPPRERGQAVPLLALVLLVAAAVLLVVTRLGIGATWRAQARTAADAAALAGAVDGEAAARRLAEANGTELVSFTERGDRVVVVVRRREAQARATAERVGGRGGDLAPVMAAALARAEQVLGRPVEAMPIDGAGLVVAVPADVADELTAAADQVGLCREPGATDPVHFAPCPSISRRHTARSRGRRAGSATTSHRGGAVRPRWRRRPVRLRY